RARSRHNLDLSADRVAVAAMSDQIQEEPMIPCLRLVMEHVNWPVVRGHDRIQTPIVVQIANGQAARDPRQGKDASGLCRYIYKAVAGVACQKHGFAIMQVGKV